MKQIRFTGTFVSADNHQYQLQVMCNSFIQAFILLTADAIRSGRHYQLSYIKNDETNSIKEVDDICKLGSFLID